MIIIILQLLILIAFGIITCLILIPLIVIILNYMFFSTTNLSQHFNNVRTCSVSFLAILSLIFVYFSRSLNIILIVSSYLCRSTIVLFITDVSIFSYLVFPLSNSVCNIKCNSDIVISPFTIL